MICAILSGTIIGPGGTTTPIIAIGITSDKWEKRPGYHGKEKPCRENSMTGMNLGLDEAVRLMLERIRPLPGEIVFLEESIDRIAASELFALVDSPSMDTSRKDGYAVISQEIAGASQKHPVRLQVVADIAAGDDRDIRIIPGTAAMVLSGARIPAGADAVVSDEYAKREDREVLIQKYAVPENILSRGSDVTCGTCILKKHEQVSPVHAGLLATAGHSRVPVVRSPRVGIIGTGDEIVLPGQPLPEGRLFASNIITLAGWCHRYRMKPSLVTVRDQYDAIAAAVQQMSDRADALVTSGGAWKGDHDLMARVLRDLGWTKVFHRIRIGPGKAAGFGLLNEIPVFILPGGPPSNLVGFLQIALPGLLALSGHPNPGLPRVHAHLATDLTGGDPDWTDFFFGTLTGENGLPVFHPMKKRSRLASIAGATALAAIPEGYDHLEAGSVVPVQVLK